MICLFKDSADDLDPKLIFVHVDVGDHLVVSRSSSAAKSRSCLKNAVCAFQFAVFSAQTFEFFFHCFAA